MVVVVAVEVVAVMVVAVSITDKDAVTFTKDIHADIVVIDRGAVIIMYRIQTIIILVAVQVLAEVDESQPLLPGEMFTEFSQFKPLTNFVLSFIIGM